MRDLDDRPRREYYPTMRSARPAHVVVPLQVGQGNAPVELARAMKVLKKETPFREIKQREFFTKPSIARRDKSARARARLKKAASRRARSNAWEEARGL